MTTRPFTPDYSEPPGAYLEEVLETRGIRKSEFAIRCGRPAKTISEIIAGKAAIMPDTALQFERVLDIPARLWLAMEASHQLRAALLREREGLARDISWADHFPVAEMVAKSFIPTARDAVGRVETLLNFFGVSSVAAWEEFWHHRVTAARFKTSSHHGRNGYAVSAWLRRGDATAALIECKPYDDTKFKAALRKLRSLTRQSWPVYRDKLIGILAEAGVALALVPDLQNLGLRGAAYWASKDKAVIILSDRLKEESRFWFALFHEAMHILLHSKKALFIDFEKNDDRNGEEREADKHAANALIPAEDLARFKKRYGSVKDSYSAAAIAAFARELDIDPSLALARLQHEELVSWGSRLTRELRKPMRF